MSAERQCVCGTWLYPNDRTCPKCGVAVGEVARLVPAAQPMAPPPGWYPAPDGKPYLQRWTGQQWTPEVQALPVVTAPTVTYSPIPTNHILHLILSILTVGMWIPIWILMTLINKSRQQKSWTRPM